MPKSKHAPALFELIDQKQKAPRTGRLELPRWWKRGQQGQVDKPDEGKVEPTEPAPAAPETPVHAVTEAPSAEPPAAAEVKPTEFHSPAALRTPTSGSAITAEETRDVSSPGSERIVRVDHGRLNFSLNYVNIAVLAFGLLVVVLISILIGSKMGGGATDTPTLPGQMETMGSLELDEAIPGTPRPQTLEVGPRSDRETRQLPGTAERSITPPAAGGQPGRVSGRNYVVIEGFQLQHREEAEAAREWLKSQGVLSTLERTDKGRLVLISVDGFSGESSAKPFIDKIKELGKKYKQEFAGKAQYSFHAPYVTREP